MTKTRLLKILLSSLLIFGMAFLISCSEEADGTIIQAEYNGTVSMDNDTADNEDIAEDISTPYKNIAGGVNIETFALLRNGMSVDEVQEIIGVTSSSEDTSEMMGITTTIKIWTGDNFESIMVMFTDGYTTSTTQMYLQSVSQTESSAILADDIGGLNEETFALLRNGMSISQVKDIVGVPATSEATTEILGISSTMIMWVGDNLNYIAVTFTDGYVTSTSQMGL